jgi:hypothetical protein
MKKSDKIENSQSSNPVWEPLKNQIRSIEVSDMLERPPSWLMRWGMYAIILAVGIVVLAASIIHYPEVIEGQLHISTYPVSSNINAGTSGIVKNIFISDSSIVHRDQPILELYSGSDWQTVQLAEKFAKDVLKSLELGDMNNLKYLSEKRDIETLGNLQETYDDLLHTISIYILNCTQRSNLAKVEINLMRLEVENQIRKLSRGIEYWKANHLFVSPFIGQFYFSKPFRRGDTIENISEIGFVVPNKFVYQGYVLVSPIDAKKMSIGQHIKLEIDEFPVVDFGLLEVIVDSVNKIQAIKKLNSKSMYRISFKPRNSFFTDRNLQIPFRPNFSYSVRIITGEKSLLKRFVEMSASDSR